MPSERYDHAEKCANEGDVVKHVALLAAALWEIAPEPLFDLRRTWGSAAEIHARPARAGAAGWISEDA